MTTMSGKQKVLLLSGPECECAVRLQQALVPHVELITASSLAECIRLLEKPAGSAPQKQEKFSGFDAFLCCWNYQGGTWRNALELMHRRVPDLPVIVVCRTGGEQEWIEVLQAGAFDMVTAPFSTESVLFALMNAVASQTEPELAQIA
ncbi:MAG: hypothetical protein HY651_08540 [Acidobacteria bacterium]|nr:hypothetical protein [Acidobacteriota bacterium]